MLRLLSDENFNGDIVRGLLRRYPQLDIVRVQDVGLKRTPDAQILSWAADHARVLISHDVSTIPTTAYDRINAGQPMPGVFMIPDLMSIGQAIEEVQFLALESRPNEWSDQVLFLPI